MSDERTVTDTMWRIDAERIRRLGLGPAEACACSTPLSRCARCEEWRCLTCDPMGSSGCDTGMNLKLTKPHRSPERTRARDRLVTRLGYRKFTRRGDA